MRLAPAVPILAVAVAVVCLGGPGPLGLAGPAWADGADSTDGQGGDADGTSPDDPSDGDSGGDSSGDSPDGGDDGGYGCPENTWTLCLQSGRFHVEIDWYTQNDDASDDDGSTGGGDDDDATNPNDGGDAGDDDDDVSNPNDGSGDDDTRGMAQVVHTTSDKSGLFYFFDPGNWEVLVKVLDGCGHNGYFWVYAAAATDVGFDIDVYDMATGHPPLQKQYRKPAGPPAPAHVDVTAFACEAAVPE